jgi:hypothetical protein
VIVCQVWNLHKVGRSVVFCRLLGHTYQLRSEATSAIAKKDVLYGDQVSDQVMGTVDPSWEEKGNNTKQQIVSSESVCSGVAVLNSIKREKDMVTSSDLSHSLNRHPFVCSLLHSVLFLIYNKCHTFQYILDNEHSGMYNILAFINSMGIAKYEG